MHRRRHHLVLVIGLILLVVAQGCAQAPPQPLPSATPPLSTATPVPPAPTPPLPRATPVPPTPPPAAVAHTAVPGAAAFPTGSFAMEDSDGQWVEKFSANGDLLVNLNGKLWVKGRYTLAQNQVVFHDVSGPGLAKCKGKGNGTYTWMLDGKALTFQGVKDECGHRRSTQVANPWVKQ